MTKEYTKVAIPDLNKKCEVQMEVLFSKEPALKETIKIKMGDQEAIISVKDLFSFAFLIGNPEQQERLLPVTKILTKKLVRQHHVKVTKALKIGDIMVTRCETDLPVEVWKAAMAFKGESQIPKDQK